MTTILLPAKELTDQLLTELGKKLSVENFVTDAYGLARLSVDKIGMIDFELFDKSRVLTMFVAVGDKPDDVTTLLRSPLEHSEMAGFSFGLDGFHSQIFLQATVPVDGLTAEVFHSIYSRYISCSQYWQKNLGLSVQVNEEKSFSAGDIKGGFIAV